MLNDTGVRLELGVDASAGDLAHFAGAAEQSVGFLAQFFNALGIGAVGTFEFGDRAREAGQSFFRIAKASTPVGSFTIQMIACELFGEFAGRIGE